jgi:hypothetical protein
MIRAAFHEQIAKCVEAVVLKPRGQLYWLGEFQIGSIKSPRRGLSEKEGSEDARSKVARRALEPEAIVKSWLPNLQMDQPDPTLQAFQLEDLARHRRLKIIVLASPG